jgi:DNA replication protein DnaC
MMDAVTTNKLHEMKLSSIADALRLQAQTPNIEDMSFDERLGLLVDAEWSRRKSNQINKLIKNANLGVSNAALENVEYHADRHLDKTQISRLGTCNYIAEKRNIIILGATGAGKSYLSCAFGVSACRNFYTVRYIRLPELLSDLAIARCNGGYQILIKQYKKVSLLILDEWMLSPMSQNEARDLLDIIECRYKTGSTIFSSQFAPDGWHSKIGEDTIADAILDRIIHNSYRIMIDGKDSMRKKEGITATSVSEKI